MAQKYLFMELTLKGQSREFEAIFKTAIALESGDPRVPFNEKTEGRKSRETVPLRTFEWVTGDCIIFMSANSFLK
jgi:hypothetical protein